MSAARFGFITALAHLDGRPILKSMRVLTPSAREHRVAPPSGWPFPERHQAGNDDAYAAPDVNVAADPVEAA